MNFYGEATSSPLHQGFGTDRLWVRWLLASDRVQKLIARDKPAPRPGLSTEDVSQSALVYGADGQPRLADFDPLLAGNRCLIEIPHDISSIKERDPQAGRVWREATRAAFLASIKAGFTVEDFLKLESQDRPRWFYLLAR